MKDLNQHMTAEEYRRLYRADAPEKKRPKVSRIRTEYNGVMYDSKLEADMAKSLDQMYKSNMIYNWVSQVRFPLDIKMKLGKPCTYRVDFMVYLSMEKNLIYLEMKGPWTDYHNQKQSDRRQMVEQKYGIKIHVCHTVKEAENVKLQAIEEVKP